MLLVIIVMLGIGHKLWPNIFRSPLHPLTKSLEAVAPAPEDISVLGSFVAKAVEVGQYDQAISTLEQHLVKYPRDARARYTLAKVYANTGS